MLAAECKDLTRSGQSGTEAGRAEAIDARRPRRARHLIADREAKLDPRAKKLLDMWPKTKAAYAGDEYVVKIRDKEMRTELTTTSLSGTHDPQGRAAPFEDDGEILRWQLKENVPGQLPVHRRRVRVQARERGPDAHVRRRGRRVPHQPRFHLLADGMPAKRLSTAFDSVTLYGNDPDRRPDIYGKVGNSGVSIATLDDMKVLYSGFDLCDPATSVSMTINGPAPTILAMFLNTAIDQQVDKFAQDNGREPTDDEADKIRAWTLTTVRGTVQADILKEDQGQNTCIFSTEFAPQGDGRHPGVLRPPRRAELLLGVDLRLSHRRGRREPDLAARLHAVERLHLRRGLPRARHAHRRLRAEPLVLLQLRHGPRVRGDRPRRAADLGGGDEAALRRQRALAEAQVPLADLAAAACTRRRSRSTTSAPRCRR